MASFQLFSPLPFLCALGFLILVLVNIQLSLSNPDMLLEACRRRFKCGNITAGYPFWGGEGETYSSPELCGHKNLELVCEKDTTIMWIKDVKYRVLNISESAQVLKIARQDYWTGECPPDHELVNTTIDSTPFEYSSGYENFTLRYGVPLGQITCSIEEMKNFIYKDGLISTLELGLPTFSVTLPVLGTFLQEAQRSLSGLEEALKQGFELKWKVNGMEICDKCNQTSGSCGYDNDFLNQTICYCLHQRLPHLPHEGACPPDTSGKYLNFLGQR